MYSKLVTFTLGGVLALGCAAAAQAQDSAPPPAPDQSQQAQQGRGPGRMDPDTQLQHMTRQLDLTPDQQSQIKPLLVDRQQKLEALRADQSSSQDDRRAKARTISQETRSKIEAILTDQQKQKFAAMQEHMRHGGGPNQGPPPTPDGAGNATFGRRSSTATLTRAQL